MCEEIGPQELAKLQHCGDDIVGGSWDFIAVFV